MPSQGTVEISIRKSEPVDWPEKVKIMQRNWIGLLLKKWSDRSAHTEPVILYKKLIFKP